MLAVERQANLAMDRWLPGFPLPGCIARRSQGAPVSGQDLKVLAAAFEHCQGTVSARAASIVELGGELGRLQ